MDFVYTITRRRLNIESNNETVAEHSVSVCLCLCVCVCACACVSVCLCLCVCLWEATYDLSVTGKFINPIVIPVYTKTFIIFVPKFYNLCNIYVKYAIIL